MRSRMNSSSNGLASCPPADRFLSESSASACLFSSSRSLRRSFASRASCVYTSSPVSLFCVPATTIASCSSTAARQICSRARFAARSASRSLRCRRHAASLHSCSISASMAFHSLRSVTRTATEPSSGASPPRALPLAAGTSSKSYGASATRPHSRLRELSSRSRCVSSSAPSSAAPPPSAGCASLSAPMIAAAAAAPAVAGRGEGRAGAGAGP
mmetsp:Transcript_10634/g.43960  ORF Transcript_10634/g.43960 Transcript_10634/m.43960 type:complete len:214 (-) Transcript_10634:106-747(-)